MIKITIKSDRIFVIAILSLGDCGS